MIGTLFIDVGHHPDHFQKAHRVVAGQLLQHLLPLLLPHRQHVADERSLQAVAHANWPAGWIAALPRLPRLAQIRHADVLPMLLHRLLLCAHVPARPVDR
jgi:hypothetical protein